MSQQNINFTASESEESSSESPVGAAQVSIMKRPAFFGAYFGAYVREAKAILTNWFRDYCPAHQGNYFEYFTTDNGGCFVVPSWEGRRQVAIPSNFYRGEMSAEAAGITAMLYTLNHVAWHLWAKNGSDPLIDLLNQRAEALKAYAGAHEEASAIFRAID
ncbi:antirestriction protein [Pantoea sp. EA-12]|uniref:antirestriction protein n=1 Tax=Pantoea sp. EA-12 TaxID=3043303 RepID=UPI0024B5BA46|nr:antirestriction protein [Pantoea sp. EA-12]MDI9221354.1 antirestriction protein [Pantoea sp. EA-12]